jgi:hypothetical protein
VRFIVIDNLTTKRHEPEMVFSLPHAMRYHDFRNGDLFPNKWFPAWCKIELNFSSVPEPDPFDLRRWCEHHCEGDVAFYSALYTNWLGFQYTQDAMSFSLTFSEIVVDQGVLEK